MLSPQAAIAVILILVFLLLVALPMLKSFKPFQKAISRRYTLAVLSAVMGIAVVIDFSQLSDTTRNTVLVGAFTMMGIFIVMVSAEKLLAQGASLKVQHGETKIEVKDATPDKKDEE